MRRGTHLAAAACAALGFCAAAYGQAADDALRRAVEADWAAQDGYRAGGEIAAIRKVLVEIGRPVSASAEGAASREALLAVYREACEARRRQRLAPYAVQLRHVVFTKHFDMGGSHYAYTEGLSDAQAERHFRPGGGLFLLEMQPTTSVWPRVRTLLDAGGDGVIRDPDVSFDGRRVLLAWKKSDRQDDYHLYELSVTADANGAARAAGPPRQLTGGLGFADYEGCYLPAGGIVFNSTRCVQTVDCWWTEVSNLYTCDGDGRFLRRVSYDQVHTNFPAVTPDGRVIYTRWDYNDRGQIYPQGLFQMNPDGTAQTEAYGNNSWFPTTLLHARAIGGTGRYVAIATGHHTRQNGWLCTVDPQRGRQENAGVQLVAPLRETPAVRIDRYGQSGDQFQYPYPLVGEAVASSAIDGPGRVAFLVAMKPAAAPRGANFGIYWVDVAGRRELLAADEKISCNQPVPLAPRPVPHRRPDLRDYRRGDGVVYLQDVHAGPGLAGVPRGAIRALRVVALEFRAAGVDNNGNRGPAGSALVSTPVSINGSWDVKVVLGEAGVQADGSACFIVPAHTPVYFQAIDANGCAAQTMRSWVTLQPGESVSCAGCHEDKNTAPPVHAATLAMRSGPQELDRTFGRPRGFSFQREIQPTLDRHCVKCHHLAPKQPPPRPKAARHKGAYPQDPFAKSGAAKRPGGPARLADEPRRPREEPAGSSPDATDILSAFSLKGAPGEWSHSYRALADPKVCSWISAQSEPAMLPPYHAGAARSKLVAMLAAGHVGRDGKRRVNLSAAEMARLACWIDLLVPCFGDYTERKLSAPGKYEHFLAKRRAWEAQERRNVTELLRLKNTAR